MSEQPATDPTTGPGADDLRIEVVDSPEDFAGMFDCCAAAFGHQINDAIWTSFNPGWDTPTGRAQGAARMADRWRSDTRNRAGDANTVFLKATLSSGDGGDAARRRVAGVAIWAQLSAVEGHGNAPPSEAGVRKDVAALHPDDETTRRFAFQMMQSLLRRRVQVVGEKAASDPPAIMVLDLCAVDPAFQRKGIATKLVQWGLDEAKRRGGLEATTEASSKGRLVYTRLGFQPEGDGADIVYDVDSEFSGRQKPPNVFLRTGGQVAR